VVGVRGGDIDGVRADRFKQLLGGIERWCAGGTGDSFGEVQVEIGDTGEFEFGAELAAGDTGGVAAARIASADDCDAPVVAPRWSCLRIVTIRGRDDKGSSDSVAGWRWRIIGTTELGGEDGERGEQQQPSSDGGGGDTLMGPAGGLAEGVGLALEGEDGSA
jgi:hypothetical protein